jgi:hypothetical protein
MADQLASPTDLAALLQQDLDTSSAVLAIELATGAIQDELGWRVLQETVINQTVLPVSASGPIQLPTAYLTSVAVTEGGHPLRDGLDYAWTTAGLVSRIWWGAPYVYPRSTYGGWWMYPLVVTYTHGFPPANVPQKIRGVCLNVAARLFDNPTGLRSEGIGQSQEVKSTGDTQAFAGPTLTPLEARALAMWKASPLVVVA